MDKTIQIINIDGTEGCGKTTQISHLVKKLKESNRKVLMQSMDDTVESGVDIIKNTKKFLNENPDGVVVNDGVIARMVALSLVQGNPIERVQYIFRDLISDYENLNHEFNTKNILLIMDDLSFCNARLKKQAELLQLSSYKMINESVEKQVIGILRNFDNYLIIINLKFHVVEFESTNSILEIHNDIMKLLE